MEYKEARRTYKGWLVVLLPSVVVVLFDLLRVMLHPPTAGGLAFLAAVLLAYWLSPRMRLNYVKITAALALAVVVAVLMALLMPMNG